MESLRAIPERLPFTKAKLSKRVVVSYIADYVLLIVLGIAFEILDAIEPFHQHFSLENYNIQYPMVQHEHVPIWLAIVIAIGGPLVIIAIYTLIIDGVFSHHKDGGSKRGPYTIRKRLWELNCGILGLFLASAMAFVITNVMKNATGKPRPDFISRCLPKPGSEDAKPFGLSNSTICTQTDSSIMKDGFRSFPSGHSSSSFAGLFYLTLYLSGKLHVYDSRGFTWKIFVIIIPTLAAALIAISRIEDSRHHPFDVLFGSSLGILCAYIAYRQYFPPLSEPWRKGRAYPIRTWGGPSDKWGLGGEADTAGRIVADTAYEQYSTAARNNATAAIASGAAPHGDFELQTYAAARGPSPLGPDDRGNVFREQVAATEQMRSGYPHPSGNTRTAYSAENRDHDWDAESSEEETPHNGYNAHGRAEEGRIVA